MRARLKEKRQALSLCHKQIAERVGVSRSYYTRIENGTSNPTYKLAIKIKQTVEYENDDLFDNEEC